MSGLAPLTAAEIKDMAIVWYRKLDIHAPLEEYKELLASEGLEMVFPEGTQKGWEGYTGWYNTVINLFFDEVHTVEKVEPTINGTEADVEVVVKWEASFWNKPDAYTKRIVAHAYQTWKVIRDAESGKPVVLTYVVDDIKYEDGSATLDEIKA